ncbi:MAG: ADP-forming succinate--CoA ligase subunit beta [Bacillota bacterium]|nr:ADP-forming succinate--CoA ligase subunit beta [Bacillota bacterium]
MKLYEYMAKELFGKAGIPVPAGRLAFTAQEAADACAELGPVAIKAQVLAGGRGKAGGIKFADTPPEAAAAAADLLGMAIRDLAVDRLLCEQKLSIERELYVGIAVDGTTRRPVLIASVQGGVNIEEVPEKSIVRRRIGVTWGLFGYAAREVVRRMGLDEPAAGKVVDILLRLYRVFRQYDAELVEINPLVILTGGEVIAADGRCNVDDDALWRQRDLPQTTEGTELERKVKSLGLSYVELDGDIAVMANGAGITMATLDIIQRYGGRPANFLDAGGGAGVEPMTRALEVLIATKPRAVLVNIFGGITRCDDVANAIVQARRTVKTDVPMVVRLSGTNEDEGIEILARDGLTAYRSMEEAAARVVALAGEAN